MVEHSDYCEVGTSTATGFQTGVKHIFMDGGGASYSSVSIGNPGGAADNTDINLTAWTGYSSNYYTSKIRQASSDLAFLTQSTVSADGAGTTTERARITSAGALLVGTTSTTANGGVLQLSSGITFPATAVAASNANTLDDYEEGTWTPTVTNMTTAGSPAYAGVYTKIGNLVMVNFYVTAGGGGTTYAATANSTYVAGLPFTTKNTNTGYQPWTGTSGNGNTTAGGTVGVQGNGTTVYFMTTISSSNFISFSLTYLV